MHFMSCWQFHQREIWAPNLTNGSRKIKTKGPNESIYKEFEDWSPKSKAEIKEFFFF